MEQTIGKKKLKKILDSNNLQYTILKKYPGKNIKVFKNLLSLILLVFRFKPSIIHIQESGDIHYLSLFLFRVPIVVTVHDVLPHFGTKFKYNTLLQYVRRCVYKNVIVHGEKLKQEYLDNFNSKLKYLYSIPHGSLFSFKNDEEKIKEEKNTILFFGRMEKYKGLKFLIEACILVEREIPGFKVLIAGDGDDLKKRKNELSKKIFEVHDEFIPNEKVSGFFKRCTLVVLPYVEASQSGVVAMAFAFKKPVIATNVGSIPEMVENGNTGLIVSPHNSDDLKDAIVYLLNHNEIRKKFSNEISILTKKKFSWDSISIETEKVYQEVMNNKSKNSPVLNTKKSFKREIKPIRTSVITNEEELVKIKNIWCKLEDRDVEITPFQTYLWNKTWWEIYGKENKLFIIMLHLNNKPVAIFPFMIAHDKYLNVTIKKIQFIGTGKSDYLSPILNIDTNLAWLHAFNYLMDNNRLWHVIELQRLPIGLKAFEGLNNYLIERKYFHITRKDKHCQGCPTVKINTGWKDFLLKEKTKKTIQKIRHKYALLSKNGTISFLLVKEKKQIKQILNIIAEVENKSWKKNSETALFHSSEDYCFMLKVCSKFAEKGKLRLLGIFVENRLIVYRIGYLIKNKFFSYSTSYDPVYKKFSPGILLLKDTIQSCFDNRNIEYNHGRGEEKFKIDWSNSLDRFYRILIFNNRLSSLLIYTIDKFIVSIHGVL
ncbi:hypothetical protein DSCA_20130 [Desulfosarcina alkanivorans]|uniref:Glycosyl transferase family 1 domain-containing protein n=1 Tax=Desulfosarcina alkanivorans TaxID=571177 RepID=A0A5K7YHP0_9BACT|nr:hypothetical protein DSCA_20130 [Desulfosarcina alkanivorans]